MITDELHVSIDTGLNEYKSTKTNEKTLILHEVLLRCLVRQTTGRIVASQKYVGRISRPPNFDLTGSGEGGSTEGW